jgi:hypothetical protein
MSQKISSDKSYDAEKTGVQTAGTVAAGARKAGNTWALFRYLLATNGIWGLFFLGAMVVVLAGVTCLRLYLGDSGKAGYPWLPYGAILWSAALIYLFVIGICWPFYMSWLMAYGLTRRQFVLCNLATGVVTITVLTLLTYILQVGIDYSLTGATWEFLRDGSEAATTGEFTGPQATVSTGIIPLYSMPEDLLYIFSGWTDAILSFLLGWVIALGFQLRRVITAAGGIIISLVIIPMGSLQGLAVTTGVAEIIIWPAGSLVQSPLAGALPIIWTLVTLLFCALLAFVLLRASKLIPIKC